MFEKTFQITFCSVFLFFCSADYLSLDGNDWTAVNQNQTIKTKARVPGSVYSDLRRESVLKEELYLGYNDVKYRWVSYDNWTYVRFFNVDAYFLSKQSINLVLEGVDTVSTIYINNQIVGQTDNQFVRYKFDVKNSLRTEGNSIVVAFMSAPIYAKQKKNEYSDKYNYVPLPECNPDKYNGECHFNFIRKMASSFSWDWGPAFPTQGIWKPIGIEVYDWAIIRDITVDTTRDQSSEWTLTVDTYLESSSGQQFDALFDISLDENQLIAKEKRSLTPERDGTLRVKFVIPIKNIAITEWFPNGVGKDTQKLYQLKVILSFPDSYEVSTQTKRIGFRTIELIQDPIKPKGLTFYFKVNGLPFYAKGTNWIPAHLLMEDLSPEYIRHLLESAKRANMNMMRVWGGGVYESDLFYQLADELGIMIWQDFMFACALYPSNDEFLKSVDSEVITQVRRLQHHPSIAIWAGNNENELGLSSWWPQLPKFKEDYYELYVSHIRNIILKEDTSRPFVSSSPSNGLESVKENYTAYDPGDTRYGDVHYYNDNGELWNWKIYPSAKFASEYGFQSYPSVQTLSKVVSNNNLTFPISGELEHRQHHPGGSGAIERQIAKYMKLPTNGGVDRFDDLVYLSQITQAMAMKTETEFYRRNRDINNKTGDGFTMGALYWQLNDIWEAPTWASIEFGGKWKVLHSYARRFLDNHLITGFEDPFNTLKISFVRDDYLGLLPFNYSIKVYKWLKPLNPVYEVTGLTKTDSFSAKVIYETSVSELLNKSSCADRTECVLSLQITNSERNIRADNFLLLTEPKKSRLEDPNLKLNAVKKRPNIEGQSQQQFDITLTAETVAPFVVLDFRLNSQIFGQFLENGFFVFEGKKTIVFETKQNLTENQIRDNLTLKTLTDIV